MTVRYLRFQCGGLCRHARSCGLIAMLLVLWCGTVSAAQPPASGNTFLIASDLHFNPMADPSLVKDLETSDPTVWESILSRSKLTAFSPYGQDTNWWLLRSALDAMQTTLPHPAFMLVTGDLLAHQFPQQFAKTTNDTDQSRYRAFVLDTVEFLALQLRKRFPEAKIFVTPGNNDEECGNYSIRAGGLFLHDTANVMQSLARGDEQFKSSWQSLGSYDVPIAAIRGMHLISFNSVFFSARYRAASFVEGCAAVASSGPTDLFAWLESRLNHAKQSHEKVWLMFHIPPGMDGYTSMQQVLKALIADSDAPPEKTCASALVPMWVPSWTAQFDDLLKRYRDTIIASFAGHTHVDDFRVIDASGSSPGFVLINPPVSPVYRQSPAFRILTFASDGSISDASVYYLTNLASASTMVPGVWQREYTFSQQWKMQGISGANLATLYRRIQDDDSARSEWFKLYNVSSSALNSPLVGTSGLSCAIEALDPEKYRACFCSIDSSSGKKVQEHQR